MKYLVFFCFMLTTAYTQTNQGRFVYEFHDSSVPPQYHRSYKISVEDSLVRFLVDSYGDILLDETYTITSQELKDFKTKLKSFKLKTKKSSDEPNGCTGGTSDSFYLFWDESSKLEGYTSQCGGTEYGNLLGNLDEARTLFKDLVPDFGFKLAGTR
jgi:hypothetical protein